VKNKLMTHEAIAFLTDNGFRAEDKRPERDYLVVSCRTCCSRWTLQIVRAFVLGTEVLALLDHQGKHR
jgi:hypothetical protein